MANYSGFNFTTFSGVNLKNTLILRAGASGSDVMGTLAVASDDEGGRAWQFPAKSGTFPIMGTFRVQLPAAVGAIASTIVTVSGLRIEDALVVLANKGVSAAYGFDNSTAYILVAAQPRNGDCVLYFQNLGNATGYVDRIFSYLATR